MSPIVSPILSPIRCEAVWLREPSEASCESAVSPFVSHFVKPFVKPFVSHFVSPLFPKQLCGKGSHNVSRRVLAMQTPDPWLSLVARLPGARFTLVS